MLKLEEVTEWFERRVIDLYYYDLAKVVECMEDIEDQSRRLITEAAELR